MMNLQKEIRKIKQEMQDEEKIVFGIFFAKDIHVQQRRIREAIHARIYSVPGPMSLWHIG